MLNDVKHLARKRGKILVSWPSPAMFKYGRDARAASSSLRSERVKKLFGIAFFTRHVIQFSTRITHKSRSFHRSYESYSSDKKSASIGG